MGSACQSRVEALGMGDWAKGRVGEGVGAWEWRAWGWSAWGNGRKGERANGGVSSKLRFYVRAEAARQPASMAPSR